jgi:uncharacterized protein YqhQ
MLYSQTDRGFLMTDQITPGIRVGGSALPDGVMMLTPLAAAIAREQPDGTFAVESFPLPARKPLPIEKIPFIRILPKLIGQMALVVRGWKPGKNKVPWGILGIAVVIGAISTGLNFGLAALPSTWHVLGSSLLQLALLFALLGVTRAVPKLGRIWRFHGGEHQAIAAYEAGLELEPDVTITRSLYHPRCGTNLAILAMVLMVPGMVFGSVMPGIIGGLVTLLIPLPAMCVAFEIVMLGQKRMMRMLLWPGLAFQRLTVATPGPAESMAGIIALRAALEEHARVAADRAGFTNAVPVLAATSAGVASQF